MTTILPNKTDLARFFADEEPVRRYESAVAEISAVQSGQKGISMFSFPKSAIDNNEAAYREVAQATLERGLALTLRLDPFSSPPREHVYVFSHREVEAWRVPAWLTTRKLLGQHEWCDGLEALESMLLGYSDEEVDRWIALHRARRASWQGSTVYLLLTRFQEERIVEHGSRSFPNGMPTDESLVWFMSRRSRPMRRDAVQQCPPNLRIARVAIDRGSTKALFHPEGQVAVTGSDIVSSERLLSEAVRLNAALKSRIEFLSTEGWC